MAANDHSGYPLKWFKDQDIARSMFECAVCLEVLKDPVQVRDCGHQFCGLCIDDILMSDPRCPSCRITISKAMIFQDHAANRLIRKLDVNCSNEDCSWLRNLSSYLEDHVNSCLFRNQAGGSNNNLDAKKLEEQFAKINLEITALKQEREIDKNEIKELKTKHENDVKELRSKHENDIKELRSKHENDVKELRSKHEHDIKELRSKHQQDIMELKQQINQILVMSNCSGTCTLKIFDFENRLRQAKSHHHIGNKITGEPFFTSCNGYKMRLYIHLDEGERGFTGYMGVYVALMRSDHDEILQWPFNMSCTFIVIDQQDEGYCREDHVYTTIPHGQDNFKRPKQNENDGWGSDRLILHSELRARKYIKDNAVCVKVLIEP